MVRGRTILLVTALLTTVLAGCGAKAEPPASDAGASAPSGSAAKVTEKLKFAGKTLDDKSFSGESLAGKPTVLWFWAPWCPRCMGEAPHMGALAKANAGKVTFVGVGAQDGVPAMRKFVAENEVSGFAHLADLDASIWTRFGITQQPAYAFVQRDGTIQTIKQQLTEEALNERVSELTAP